MVLWISDFIAAMGMSIVLPFLPLYIEQLGVHETAAIEKWTGWIFAAQFVFSFLFQPLWGSMADKYGRKIMLLRAGFGMGIVTALMGLVTSPLQLLILRIINGIFSGFLAMSVSLQASVTPDAKSGRALGMLQTGSIAGSLLGPLLGGILAENMGYHSVFFLTGGLLFLASFIIIFFVHEDHHEQVEQGASSVNHFSLMKPLFPVFLASFITNVGMMSIEPLATVYVKTLYHGVHLEFLAGLVVSITGIANLVGSPTLGKIGDKIGQRRILAFSLFMAAMSFIPQVFASGITMLLIGRFTLGLFVGGMIPSLNVLVKKLAPPEVQATAFGLNTSSLFLGNFVGPLIGSQIAAVWDIHMVFYVTMSLLIINSFMMYINHSVDCAPKHEHQVA